MNLCVFYAKNVSNLSSSALKGIADGELVTQGFAETGHVVVSGFACVVGGMDAYSQVETDDQEVQVVPEAYTCSQGYGIAEVGHVYLPTRLLVVLAQQPYVTGIDKGGSVQVGDYGEAVFYVGLELQVASLVYIGVGTLGRMIRARAYAADGEGAYTVGTSDGEEVVIGCCGGVAVAVYDAGKDACGQAGACGKRELAGVLGRGLYKLCKGYTEEFLALLVEALSEYGIDAGCYVACLFNVYPEGLLLAVLLFLPGEGVLHAGDELVAHGYVQSGVGLDDGVELGRTVQ